jgi:malate dehydrogenase (oxaloacetate-decarboxylating)(NADP+)
VARLPVPDQVKAYYPGQELEFGPEYIIPKPFDRRLFVEVPHAVASAAAESGLVRGVDLQLYRTKLAQRNESRLSV